MEKRIVDKLRMQDMSIASLGKHIREDQLSPVKLTEYFLTRIASLDPKLGAFRLVCRERAMAEARATEMALRAGQDLGPLHGIPYAAKDLFDIKGLPTTAGCHLLEDNIASRDSWAIRRLGQAGMILLGKTNTVQFAYSGIGINHDHGTPHNPWRTEPYIPGGSSSGSAVAVAAGLTPMALGTDTGGSVRIPSSLCGTTGLKTTVGRISRAGVYPLSWTLDSVGPLTCTAEDAALVYTCLQGFDLDDDTTWGSPPQDVLRTLRDGVRGVRLAFAESVFWEDAHPEVETAVRECGIVFKDLGAYVTSIEFKEAEKARKLQPSAMVIAAEAYSVNKEWVEEHYDELDPVIAVRLVKGKAISATEYLENLQACKTLQSRVNRTLQDVDALLVPTTVIPSSPVTEVDANAEIYTERNLTYLRNTSIGNILNLCALTVPCGFTREGLPVGLLIYGKSFQEDVVLRVGYAFQQATDWHQRMPKLGWAKSAAE